MKNLLENIIHSMHLTNRSLLSFFLPPIFPQIPHYFAHLPPLNDALTNRFTIYIDNPSMRRQFSATYQQAISLIKQLKNSNDHLNRAIGVDTSTIITARLKRQQPLIENTTARIEELVQKLEQSYLDPDTARKIGTAKQQFRIQRDRRNQLLASAHYEETHINGKDRQDKEMPSMESVIQQPQPPKSHVSTWSRFTHKQSEVTNDNTHNQRQEQQQIEFQMQRKLMHERNQEINIVANSIMNVHNIMKETGVLVHEQGEQLDIIGEEIFTTYRNANAARDNVTQANELQQRARRKYVTMSLLILLLLAVGAVVLLV